MMTQKQLHALLLFVLVLVAACIPQTPIPVYVTPTPQVTDTTTAIPTVGGLAPTETPSAAPVSTSVTVSPVGSPQPTMTFLGSIIGPDYTPPPTSTPRPAATRTPTEAPTAGPTTTPAPPTATHTPSGPTPTPLPGLDPAQMGVQLHSLLDQNDWNEVLRLTSQLELGWAKVQIDWDLLEPNRGEIGVDFRRQELYIESLKQRGMKVLVSVAKAPAWSRSNQVESGPPDDPQALVDFLNVMLNEFGNAIDAVEIWNEPNLLREWQGRPLNGGEYMRYFRPAYEAINAYSQRMATDPQEPRSAPIVVVTAGLAPTGTSDFSVDDRVYLRQMYDAGLANFPDVMIGAHPFSWGNPPDARCCDAVEGQGWDDNPHFFFSHTIEEYRNLMVQYGHASQIWITEFGWATWDEFPGDPPEVWMTYNNKWQQAAYTLRAFEIGQATDYIGPMFLWNMNFAWLPTLIENRDERAAYSLLTPLRPQQERPLYWMLYDAVRPDVQLDRYDAG
jgi:hypothetical protein